VGLALTIDLAKATFLPAAAHYRAQGRILGPLLLLMLWCPALGYSTFAGYAYLTTTRAAAHVEAEAQENNRNRVSAAYDRASADLATAKQAPEWDASAACTRPRTKTQRSFCANVADTVAKLDATSERLTTTPLHHINPEISGLATITGWSIMTLTFLIAFVPAVLIELVAGLGLYALRGQRPVRDPHPSTTEASQRRAKPFRTSAAPQPQATLEKAPNGPSGASATTVSKPVRLTWSLPAKS